MNCGSVLQNELKGWLTYRRPAQSTTAKRTAPATGYEDAKLQNNVQGNRWTATEYNSNNAWNSNFGNGNFNPNNNKNNSMSVRPVAAYDNILQDFILSVYRAFDDCCKNKRTTSECIAYTERANEDLPLLARQLFTLTYQPGPSTCFLVKYPKPREVFAAGFRDRIVHHWIYMQLNVYFERLFTVQGNVSYNCRRGLGTLAAQRAAYNAIEQATANYQRPAWVYRGDLVSFFMSISKRRLWAKLEPFIRQNYGGQYMQQILAAVRTTVFHRPEANCIFNTDPKEWSLFVDDSKSLFTRGEDYGMPIGNLTTQVFANFYMADFDAWVQEWFRSRGATPRYVRFVDDFLVVSDRKPLLRRFVREASVYLANHLGLTLHTDKYHFQPASHGVKFVGAYLKPHRTYLANRTIARLAERVHGFARLLKEKDIVTFADLRRIEQVINSYLGFCKGKRTYALRKRLLSHFGSEFYRFFFIRGHYETIAIKRKAQPQIP